MSFMVKRRRRLFAATAFSSSKDCPDDAIVCTYFVTPFPTFLTPAINLLSDHPGSIGPRSCSGSLATTTMTATTTITIVVSDP